MKLGFRIVKPRIPDTTSKILPDSGIRITLHEAIKQKWTDEIELKQIGRFNKGQVCSIFPCYLGRYTGDLTPD